GVLGRVHNQPPLVVLHRGVNRAKRRGYVLGVHPKEAADRDDDCRDFAALVDKHVDDLTDLVVGRVVDILLVPVGNGDAVRRYSVMSLSMEEGDIADVVGSAAKVAEPAHNVSAAAKSIRFIAIYHSSGF